MSTIEIYLETPVQQYYCLYCGFNMTIKGQCVPCNEYKSAATIEEYFEMHGHYPKLKLVKS